MPRARATAPFLFAACLDLSGAVRFEAVSRFLSELAGAIVARALRMAEARARGSTRSPCRRAAAA